jgi:nitric oxide reductase NorQ protein
MSKYLTYYKAHYDNAGAVVVYDGVAEEYLDLSARPDIKQRAEKAINTNTVLVTYKRGTRNGFKYIEPNELEEHFSSLKAAVSPTTQPILRRLETLVETKPSNYEVSDLNWKFILRNILRSKNLLIVGPSGCGKTQLVFEAAKAVKQPVEYFNLGATQDPRSTLVGNTHYDNSKGTYFSESAFVKAIQTPNTVILLDEISRAHPEAWNILMTVLDEKLRYLRLDEKDNTPLIKVAEGVSFVSTANIGAEYTATRVLDRALKDRFSILEVEPLGFLEEINVLSTLFDGVLEYDDFKKIANVACKTRTEANSNDPKISTIISTRKTIEWCEMMVDGFTFEEAAQIVVYPLFPDDGDVDSERVFVKQLLQKYSVDDSKLSETLDEIFK